jgi:hypothetical protein
VAMVDSRPVKVECLSCHKQHAYRAYEPGAAKPKARRSSTGAIARTTKVAGQPKVKDLEVRLKGGERDARAYSPKDRYTLDEIVRHPQFGCGLVVALPALQRMEVAFIAGRKLLVHDRTS